MSRKVAVALFCVLLLPASLALAWGPHPDIGNAGARALDKDDPFRAWIGNIGLVGPLSWWNDMAGGGAIVSVGKYHVYARDCFEIPGLKFVAYSGHGRPGSGTYEAYFSRLLQAMHTETTEASMGWLGAVLHDAEDTGAPPHAAMISGPLHGKMENWVDGKKIDITGYEPRLLGKTEEEALKGYVKRLTELSEYSRQRAKKIKPLAEADDRAACEPLILECANETARAVADVLHTLGYLQSQMKPVPGTAGLAGTIASPADPNGLTPKIMLEGTKFSTFADIEGRYGFRNLPPGKYKAFAMMPRCKPQTFEVTLEADMQVRKDVDLAANDNLLRNGDMSVRWLRKDRPDTWYASLDRDKVWRWTSAPFTVTPGQRLQVRVKWAKDSDAQVNILWKDGKWIPERAIGPDAEDLNVTVPAAKGPFSSRISILTRDGNLKSVEDVSVVVVSEASTQPSDK